MPDDIKTETAPPVARIALLAELEAALSRDACIIAKIARRGDDPKSDPAFARYCALEDALEAERRYSANDQARR